eukprot:s597_g2.t1
MCPRPGLALVRLRDRSSCAKNGCLCTGTGTGGHICAAAASFEFRVRFTKAARMARRQVNRAAVLPLAVAAVLACVTKFCAFTLPQPSSRRSDRVRLNAEGKCIGNCLQPDGSWKPTGEIDIQGPEEEALAQSVWEAFQEQYTGAAERGMYMDTPVGENDIKRLRDTFGITSEEAVGIMQTDALPLVIDADYVQDPWQQQEQLESFFDGYRGLR